MGGLGTYFFALSQRRPSDDGKFNGIVSVAVLPNYFEDFYAKMGRTEGSYYGMARADGGFLARFPVPKNRLLKLDEHSQFRIGISERLGPLYLLGRFAARRHRPPHRLPQADRFPGLCARRRGKIGDRAANG